MSKKMNAIAIIGFALLVVLGTANPAKAQDAATKYTKMAPVDQYLMADRNAEIALARSAAPESIARDAGVLVLTRHGFETAVKGTNGFVCIVGRGWTSAADPDYWNPKVRVPMCVNAAAARSYLVHLTKETEWGLAGRTPAQMNAGHQGCHRQKRTAADGAWGHVLHDGEGRIRRRQPPPLAFSPDVFLYGCRPGNLGSESAGFPRRCRCRPRGAPDAIRDSCAALVRRNGISRRLGRRASSVAPTRKLLADL